MGTIKANRNYYLKQKHPCIDCGKLTGKYYTRCPKCAAKDRLRRGVSPTYKFINLPGKDANHWQGGRIRTLTRDGYIFLKIPNHHRALKSGYVAEHIFVWEKENKKELPKGWIVHHLNGIKDDNRPANLVGLSRKNHSLILEAKAKRIQELEALLNGQAQLI